MNPAVSPIDLAATDRLAVSSFTAAFVKFALSTLFTTTVMVALSAL